MNDQMRKVYALMGIELKTKSLRLTTLPKWVIVMRVSA